MDLKRYYFYSIKAIKISFLSIFLVSPISILIIALSDYWRSYPESEYYFVSGVLVFDSILNILLISNTLLFFIPSLVIILSTIIIIFNELQE